MKEETKIPNIFQLEEGKHYSTIGLRDYLNNTFGAKKTQKPFTIGDIQQYVSKGRLPLEYGGHPITEFENKVISIKWLGVDFDRNLSQEIKDQKAEERRLKKIEEQTQQ